MVNPANLSALIGSTDPANARALADHIGDVVFNVKSFGAKGDPALTTPTAEHAAIQNCFYAAFGTKALPHGHGSNPMVFFPAGEYVINAPLHGHYMNGGGVIGSGKHVTTIRTTATSSKVLDFPDGFWGFKIANLSLVSPGGANSSCLYMTRTDHLPEPPNFASAFIAVENCSFEGAATGAYMGWESPTSDGQSQTSEMTWMNCDFLDCGIGCWPLTLNALNYFMIGGSCRGCGTGLFAAGTFPSIFGMLFSGNTKDIEWNIENTFAVIGCYSESEMFLVNGGHDASIIACYHANPDTGEFLRARHRNTIDCCHSTTGRITQSGTTVPSEAKLYFRGSRFGNSGFKDTWTGFVPETGYVIG